MQYETPLYVVPTSKASTNLRERPRYGSQEDMLWAHGCASILRQRGLEAGKRTYPGNPASHH